MDDLDLKRAELGGVCGFDLRKTALYPSPNNDQVAKIWLYKKDALMVARSIKANLKDVRRVVFSHIFNGWAIVDLHHRVLCVDGTRRYKNGSEYPFDNNETYNYQNDPSIAKRTCMIMESIEQVGFNE